MFLMYFKHDNIEKGIWQNNVRARLPRHIVYAETLIQLTGDCLTSTDIQY